jgi:hypothetical protein
VVTLPSTQLTQARDPSPRIRLRDWNGEGRNRTGDTTIFSRVLYRLSYLAEARGRASSRAHAW